MRSSFIKGSWSKKPDGQTNQDHAAQVAKLRAAKEEADAKQAQVRREMKEDMERLRTQFIFKVSCLLLDIITIPLTWPASNMKSRPQFENHHGPSVQRKLPEIFHRPHSPSLPRCVVGAKVVSTPRAPVNSGARPLGAIMT